MRWDFACPSCRAVLTSLNPDQQRCPRCEATYRREDGIWRLLAEGRLEQFREFIERYETVRTAEGRRIQNADALRALPFRDRSRKRDYEWRIRAKSYRTLIRCVIEPFEKRVGRLRIADLGSGLGWLAYRLTLRGHDVAAVDLLTNDFDGLGVHRQYGCAFESIQAEFECLPFADASIDIVIYNAAFHYAKDYVVSLTEAVRVLGPGGSVVITDTPIYRDGSSGVRMVEERDRAFLRLHGFRGTRTEAFLTYHRLDELQSKVGVRWELYEPWYGLRWWSKPWLARLRGTREPARFKLVVGYPLRRSSSSPRGPLRRCIA
jgi:SAM-dependent methyltransferase